MGVYDIATYKKILSRRGEIFNLKREKDFTKEEHIKTVLQLLKYTNERDAVNIQKLHREVEASGEHKAGIMPYSITGEYHKRKGFLYCRNSTTGRYNGISC